MLPCQPAVHPFRAVDHHADRDVSLSVVVVLFLPKSDLTQNSSEQCTYRVLTAENAIKMVE